MKFYDALQMDPSVLKKKIALCQTRQEKLYYWFAMALRSMLTVAFAIVFISTLAKLFGQENSPMAVALFCILLGIRFVNFEYCIGDSMINLAVAFAILLLAPTIVTIVPSFAVVFTHFVSFFALLYITSQRPELGNGGLFNFAYIYLVGNPVHGEALCRRALLTLVGYVICGTILFAKHRHMHKGARFAHVIKRFDLSNMAHLWQLRMAVGVSMVLTAGQLFGVKRFMWMGFACASLLSQYPYNANTTTRFWQRIVGVVAGSGLYYIIAMILPESLHPMMGPFGGFCLGFCTDYRFKTAINCFGALMMASGIYGIQGAAILRIEDTIMGVIFGWVIAVLFHKLVGSRFTNEEKATA